MSGIFDENQTEITLETLVGEGKKYKDADELAKAYAHADATIKAREGTLDELRGELGKRLSFEDLVEQLKTTNKGSETPPAPASDTPKAPETDLVERVRAEVQALEEARKIKSNRDAVVQALVETFGSEDKAAEAVRAKASELGVSLEFLQSVADKSPKAFFSSLGLDQTAVKQAGSITHGDVNTEALNAQTGQRKHGSPGTMSYYRELYRTDPQKYFSPAVQNQIMKEAFDKGDAFLES